MNCKPYIAGALKQLEDEYNIQILFAADAGSRSYGWASVNSDFDVHVIYLRKPIYYITIQEKQKTIEKTYYIDIPRNLLTSVVAVDQPEQVNVEVNISAFDIKHALLLFSKTNPAIMHMLNSPVVYINKDEYFNSKLHELCTLNASRRTLCSSMMGIIKVNFNKYITTEAKSTTPRTTIRLKAYLYIMHHLLFVHKIYKETVDLSPDQFEIVKVIKSGKLIEYKKRIIPYDTPFPNLEIISLMNAAQPHLDIYKKMMNLLQEKKKSTEQDPVVPRDRLLELYFLLLYKKLNEFSYYLPRVPEISLDELDTLFHRVLNIDESIGQ
ncbi:hypothetical protein AKO1_012742 [Acrasis kona]|uniref:Nucleotidyltransferase n=1 Tax=Acrasis kona TaxID=1008807 RepID=A0AAW2YYF4_9EUKA